MDAEYLPAAAVVRLTVPARLEWSNRSAFRAEVLTHAAMGLRELVLAFAPNAYVDSAGLGTLILLNKLLKANGITLVLEGLHADLMDLMAATKLDQHFTIRAPAREG